MKKNPVDPSKIKKNDLMYFVYAGFVEQIERSGTLLGVKWVDKPEGFRVDGKELVVNAYSADQYTEEKKVNQTECIDRLMVSFNRPFTVCWDTKDTENRELRGKLISSDPKRGYSMVEDMDVDGPAYKRIRQVDHRTLHWLIVDGTKFVVGRK
ncbi:hypothetical protein C4577_02115 [Candidatus Parcubacteria bacterium]|nr:MAG: hypothetical protein C4577_02115 [Candidatus Parcubacteria bacterium]